MLAELFLDAGLPEGVFNVVHGGRAVVDAFCSHPGVASISFVGSTGVARHVYTEACKHGKRVQSAGGASAPCCVGGSASREFRASAVVPAPLAEVVAWWRDPSTYTRWINRCAEARRIEVDTGANANYLKFDFPFPASDRDVVVRARKVEESANRVVFEGRNVDGLVPEVSGVVRIAMLRSRWEFRARGDAATEVVYRQHMDAGGRLPAFILKRAAVDSPFQTLRGLIRYAEANRSP